MSKLRIITLMIGLFVVCVLASVVFYLWQRPTPRVAYPNANFYFDGSNVVVAHEAEYDPPIPLSVLNNKIGEPEMLEFLETRITSENKVTFHKTEEKNVEVVFEWEDTTYSPSEGVILKGDNVIKIIFDAEGNYLKTKAWW